MLAIAQPDLLQITKQGTDCHYFTPVESGQKSQGIESVGFNSSVPALHKQIFEDFTLGLEVEINRVISGNLKVKQSELFCIHALDSVRPFPQNTNSHVLKDWQDIREDQ